MVGFFSRLVKQSVNNIDSIPELTYNHPMDNTTDIIAAWAEKLRIGDIAADELARQLALANPSIEEAILKAVSTAPESPIAFCASSIVKVMTPVHRDKEKHLDLNADSCLAIVPVVADTYADFSLGWNSDIYKVPETFKAVVDAASLHFDVPACFVFDPDTDMHMVSYMRGAIIRILTMSFSSDVDLEWLGEHSEELAPYSATMYERGDSSQTFCESLLSGKAPAVSSGIL